MDDEGAGRRLERDASMVAHERDAHDATPQLTAGPALVGHPVTSSTSGRTIRLAGPGSAPGRMASRVPVGQHEDLVLDAAVDEVRLTDEVGHEAVDGLVVDSRAASRSG